MYTKTYSSRKVIEALNLYEKVKSFRKTSSLCGIGKSTIHRWWSSLHFLRNRKRLQRKKTIRKPKYQSLDSFIKELFSDKKLTIYSLKQIRDSIQGSKLSISTLFRSLKRNRVSRRRFDTCKVCPRSVSEMNLLYRSFSEQINSFQDDEIVCIDETYLCNIGNPNYGYFSKGKEPIVSKVPQRKRYSIMMAVSPTGVISITKQRRPFNKESFNSFIEDTLLPSLSPKVKAVLMDNVAFHKNKEFMRKLEDSGITCLFILSSL